MSAIAGLVRVDGGPIDVATLRSMRALLAHRGPTSDTWVSPRGSIGLVQRQFPRHPGLHTATSGTQAVAFAGTLQVESRSPAGSTARAAAERVLEGFADKGPGFAEALRGQFAYAVADEAKHEVVLARDPLGVAPLYWSFDGSTCAFASEIKGVLAAHATTPPLDDEALAEYVATQGIGAPRTLFRGVHKLQPGHWLRVRPGGRIQVEAYWEVPGAPPDRLTPLEAADRIDAELTRTITDAVPDGAEVGVILDGSVERALLAARATQLVSGARVHTFTPDPARLVRARGRVVAPSPPVPLADHHRVALDPSRFVTSWIQLTRRFDAPVPSPRDVVSSQILAGAPDHVGLLVAAEGADSLFAGGTKYQWAYQWVQRRRIPPLRVVPAPVGRIQGWHNPFSWRERQRLMGPTIRHHHRDRWHGSAGDLVQQLRYVDLHTRLSDVELESADRLAMTAGLAHRPIFADHEFVEAACTLPSSALVHHNTPKWVLHELYRRHTGHHFRSRISLDPPIDAWLRGPLARWTKELLLGRDAFVGTTFDRSAVATLLAGHRRGHHHGGSRIFALVGLELWHRAYLA